MKRYSMVPVLTVLALGACSAATREQPAASTPVIMAGAHAANLAASATGQEIFDAVCSTCHSVQPPARTAPPMSHVARHYRDTIPDRDRAVERIAQWVQSPAADRSLLPAHAIEQWGLMPPLALETRQIRAVAEYVWGLADQAMGEGMGMGGGHGMQMGRDTMAAHGMAHGMGVHHAAHMNDDTARVTTGMHGMGMMHRRGTAPPDTSVKKD